MSKTDVVFFATPAEWRAWLEENHDKCTEIQVGYYKKGSGKPTMTWPESVDQALCYGWIDGIRKSIDDISYTNRFTPRKPRSNWSSVNIKRVGELMEQGLMHPAGTKAFEERDKAKSQQYSYENRPHTLSDEYLNEFHTHKKAWEFFQSQPPSYQKTASHWVMSAKREETRSKRLATLIEDSQNGLRIGLLRR